MSTVWMVLRVFWFGGGAFMAVMLQSWVLALIFAGFVWGSIAIWKRDRHGG